jgi:hypothetical protein
MDSAQILALFPPHELGKTYSTVQPITMAVLNVRNLVIVSLVCVLSRAAYQVVYYRYFHHLSKFPGTFWSSVTRLWITWHNVKEDECATFQELHEKHGKHSACS